jgi:predicted metal-dependent HD superfamily phosphohydrolase
MKSEYIGMLQQFYTERYPVITERLKNEMSPGYTYHCLEHVLDVLDAVEKISKAEQCDDYILYVVKIACLYHDIGFIYQRKEHEQRSAEVFEEDAIKAGLNQILIKDIYGCIMATKIPQGPHNRMEQIVCDADLDYLGRDDYDEIAEDLFKEMQFAGELSDPVRWKEIQIQFLTNHRYHTKYSRDLRYEPMLRNLARLSS